MVRLINYIIVVGIVSAFFACNKKTQAIPHYTVSKEFKTDSFTTVNVHINNRMTADQLLLIADKLKTDSAKIQNLDIHYLLPGNTDFSAGDNSYYASARYVKENEVKPTDTLKDDNGNVVRLKIFGLSSERAKSLLAIQPKEITGNVVNPRRFTGRVAHVDPNGFANGISGVGVQFLYYGELALQLHEQELESSEARSIQQGLLPKEIPQFPGYEIATAWQSARVVGGDYFDVLPFDADSLGLCKAD